MKHVIFDFDGTLVDSLPVAVRIANQMVPGLDLSPNELEKIRAMSAKELLTYSGIPYWRLVRLLFRGKKIMAEHTDDLHVFKGMQQVIRQLHDEQYQVSVVSSNSEKIIRKVLEREGIADCFVGVYGNVGLFNKSRVFKTVLKDQKAKASQAIYIGDEVRDIDAAHRSYIPIISVAWGYNAESVLVQNQPDHLVHTPKELLRTIREVAQG